MKKILMDELIKEICDYSRGLSKGFFMTDFLKEENETKVAIPSLY